MTQFKKNILWILVIIITGTSPLFCVTKLDIKTEYSNKKEYALAKAGLIGVLKTRPDLFKVCETGEDFSVWIKNFYKRFEKNDMIVSLDLELRTPAMFTKGKFLKSITILDTINLSTITTDKTFEEKEMYQQVELQLKKSGNIQAFVFSASEMAGNATTGSSIGSLIVNLCKFFGFEAGTGLKANEALMGMSIGTKIANQLKILLNLGK